MTVFRLAIFIFLLLFILNGCASTIKNEDHSYLLDDALLIEQAKLSIHKKFPAFFPDDLILLKEISGSTVVDRARQEISKEQKNFYPIFFMFRSKSSTTTLQVKNQSILFFDLISIGIYSDGTLNPNDRDARITKAVSTVINPPVEDWDEDELFQVTFFDIPLQSLIPVYASFKGLEFAEYTGPYATVTITCFTEKAIPQKYVLVLIEQTLSKFHISISLSPENKIIGVYNHTNNT